METTKEMLEARVRETPLLDRLKGCRQRIGTMCSEGRPPRMCIPVQHDDDDFFISTTLADAQATVEALQAQLEQVQEERSKYIHAVGLATTCAADMQIDTSHPIEMMQEVCKRFTRRTAELEAVREQLRLANIDQANAEARANDLQQQVEALRRARDEFERERDQLHAALMEAKAAIDAERELSAAWAEKAREYELELYGDPQNFHGRGRTIGVREHLSQLQALVRALPVVSEVTSDTVVNLVQQYSFHAWILRALQLRATLDATTPATTKT